ncbi:DUF4442 domain-containing protein [Actinacidiphila glaucinigra]|uniref:DUF4442 domain-containing protein n=1 Tax=Actinacidiphila glaucinigra TaxID=235986 RepID=UPI0033A532AD
MDIPIQLEQASDPARQCVQNSFDRRDRMAHLGAPPHPHRLRPRPHRVPRPARGLPAARIRPRRRHRRLADNVVGYAARTLFRKDAEVLSVEFEVNLLGPVAGDHSDATDTVLKPGRTPTACHWQVYSGQGNGEHTLLATG